VYEYEREEATMVELLPGCAISREMEYVWLQRYQYLRVTRPLEQNPRLQRFPRQMPESLEQDQPRRTWPAPNTIGTLLKNEGLVVASTVGQVR
jgi:hypothetical protein